MGYKDYPRIPESGEDWEAYETANYEFRKDPTNFVFNYIPANPNSPFPEDVSYWCIGLRGLWEEKGYQDDDGWEMDWTMELGLAQEMEGVYSSWNVDSDEDITAWLLHLGVEFDPKYGLMEE
jgi:hypothetical protein